MTNTQDLTELLEIKSFINCYSQEPFKPISYYDSRLDAIRVHLCDCSYTEEPITPTLTLYRGNHEHEGQIVGFSVESASTVIGCQPKMFKR